MVAGQAGELQRRSRMRAQVVAPTDTAGDPGHRRLRLQHADDDRAAQCGQLRGDLRDALQAVERLPAVAVAVGSDEHSGPGLAEAVDHTGHAEVAGGGGERGPDRVGCEERDDRLGDVRHVGGHLVAGLHPVGRQRRRERRHLGTQLGPCVRAALAVLGDRDDRVLAGALAEGECVLGVGHR